MRWLLWRWGTRGSSPAILTIQSLDQHDRGTALGQPILLKPEEENLPFSDLVKLYPPPTNQEFPDHVSKPRKSAD
jgi:hypothetical protein